MADIWIVDKDPETFFDTVEHDKLMTLIGKTIKDGEVLFIVKKFLVSEVMMDDKFDVFVIRTP